MLRAVREDSEGLELQSVVINKICNVRLKQNNGVVTETIAVTNCTEVPGSNLD